MINNSFSSVKRLNNRFEDYQTVINIQCGQFLIFKQSETKSWLKSFILEKMCLYENDDD